MTSLIKNKKQNTILVSKHTVETSIGNDIQLSADLLKQSELVAIPTETVYGLAANALDAMAVTKIFEAKNRPFFDPLIVHIHSIQQLNELVLDIPPQLLLLAQKFWPGALTILLPKKNIIPEVVTAGLPNVGIRIPNQALTLSLLQQINFPLAAPSANPFSYVSPTTAAHVYQQLQGKIPYILDGGKCSVGIESTIVGMHNNQASVFRLGGISIEEIEGVIGKVNLNIQKNENPNAPGMLSLHYAPHKTMIIGNIKENIKKYATQQIGVISFKDHYSEINPHHCKVLSPQGNLNEAAQNLFAAMRTLDQSTVDIILTEKFPEMGLGPAINDRLQRASYKNNSLNNNS